ncbi:MAG TPA: hypothetical protein VFU23_02005 [Gemmatimonadales bacterium]|nr:hypothetical protein [Gemmatimonadales bacterium]
MIRKVVMMLIVFAAAGLGFLAYARFEGAALPGMALPPLPVAFASAVQADDSAAVARMAETRCRLLKGDQRRLCFEEVLLDLVHQDRIRLALGALNLLGQRDAIIRRFGHDYSHVIGINAWTPGKNIGDVYMQCSELFQSGCYHGVIQAFFAYQGTDSASVAALCRDTPGIRDSGWLRFQCVHGIGHGLVQTYTMNLPRALDGCDKLGNGWDSESCYGGAFMEFIVGGRGQSHHVHLPKKSDSAGVGGGDEHAGMDMSGGAWPPFKVRDTSDLLYPCSALAERYQHACYQMQAGLVVERTGLDFVKVAAVCDTAPENMRATCYQGIGTYVSGVTSRDAEEGIRLCTLGSNKYRPWCFVGLVKNFVDVTANPDDGLALCRKLTPVDAATSCYHAVGEAASVLYPSMSKRDEVCSRVIARYANACRYGAGLSTERPAELPRR